MPQTTQISIAAEESLYFDARLRQYVLCLGMVHLIVERELNKACNIALFRQLGIVASFIDQQLDELDLEQRKNFLNQFDELFENLINSEKYTDFYKYVNSFITTQKMKFSAEDKNLVELYSFISYCIQNNLDDYLRNFGIGIIKCSIAKQSAKTTREIRLILRQEGKLVCGLLENLLKIDHSDNQNLSGTIKFLVECEQILNLGDDCVDAFEDNQTNIIQIQNARLHGILMFGYVLKQVVKTFVLFPKQFLFYAPTLTGYYLKNK